MTAFPPLEKPVFKIDDRLWKEGRMPNANFPSDHAMLISRLPSDCLSKPSLNPLSQGGEGEKVAEAEESEAAKAAAKEEPAAAATAEATAEATTAAAQTEAAAPAAEEVSAATETERSA